MVTPRHMTALGIRLCAAIVLVTNAFGPAIKASAEAQKGQSAPSVEIATGLTLGSSSSSPYEKVPILAEKTAKEAQSPAGSARPPQIQVTAEPAIYIPGKPIQLSWKVLGLTAQQSPAAIVMIHPSVGASPVNPLQALSPDGTLSMAATSGASAMVWKTAAGVQLPLEFTVDLVVNGAAVDTESVIVDQPRYSVAAGNSATLRSQNGKVQLGIPAADASEPLALDIRDPGPNALEGVSKSWQPVEILAVGQNSQRNLHSFKAPLTVQMQYDVQTVQANGWDENALSIYYYDPDQNDWFPIDTQVDKVNHTLTVQSDHLTVFDWNANNWQSQSLPTVDTFRVSDYTGAATYDVNLWTPPGPGGLQPSVALSYNSQVIDESSAYTQASWAGMGWNLDTGAILRNMHGTDSDTTDDTFSISAGGVSGLLLPISTGGTVTNYNTADQSFMKVQFDSSTNAWTAWTKDGTRYAFSTTANTNSTSGCSNTLDLTWRWSLTTVTDTHNNHMDYTYSTESKAGCPNQISVYPATITYANGKYRVNFLLDGTARTDYQTGWTAAAARTLYGTQRLGEVQIQYNPSGSWTNVRRYVPTFAPNTATTNVIYPNFNWSAGGKTLTLRGIQEYSADGSVLPAAQFTYDDSMHLTGVDNGQGGQVQMTYERQALYDDVNKDLRTLSTLFGSSSSDECWYHSGGFQTGTSWTKYSGSGSVGCYWDGSAWLRVVGAVGLRPIPENVSKPGSRYRLLVQGNVGPTKTTTGVNWGFWDTSCTNCDQIVYSSRVSSINLEQSFEMPVTYNPANTKLYLECDDCQINKYQFQLYLTYYRVIQRTVTIAPTGVVSTYTYNYMGFAMNNADNSAAVAANPSSALYSRTLREYRGHAMSEVVDPGGMATLNWFNQTDTLKGRAYDTLRMQQTFFGLSTGWTAITGGSSRDSASLGQGKMAIAHLNLSGTNAQGQVSLSGSPALTVLLGSSGASVNGTQLLNSGNFILGTDYGLMIFVDGTNGFRVRMWQLTNPANAGEAVITGLGAGARTFSYSASTGTLALDGYAEGIPYSETITNYSSTVQYDTISSNSIPDLAQSGLLAFKDLQVAWNSATSIENRTYNGDAAFVGTRQTMTYDQYGNPTSVMEEAGNNGTWTPYRTTTSEYYPNATSYVINKPARQVTQDSVGNSESESLYFYDNSNAYTTPPTQGALTIQRALVQASDYSQLSYGYDSYGNRTTQTSYTAYGTATTAPASSSQEITTTTYETTYHTYATSVSNALLQPTQTAYDYSLGVPTSMTDPNNAVTSATYDGFGRLKTITAPGDGSPTLQVTYYDTRIPFQVDLIQRVDGTASIRLSRFYDGAGQQIQTQTVGAVVNGVQKNVVVDSQFNSLGLLIKQTVPYAITYNASPAFVSQGFSQPYTQTGYDNFERPATVTAPNGNQTQTSYSDLTTTVNDPRGNATTTTLDAWGRTTRLQPATGPDVSYQYNVLNRLTDTTRAGNVTHIDYDNAGRKTQMRDPDMGTWNYQYDAMGNLTVQNDARICQLSLGYDKLNRLTSKSSSGNCGTQVSTTFTYDQGTNGIGRRTGMADNSGSSAWTYDNRGRMLNEVKTITGASPFTTSWTYNSADLPVTMTYPDSEVLTYGYNSDGSLNSMTSSLGVTYASGTQYDEAGRLTSLTYGAGIMRKIWSYFAWNTSIQGGMLSSAAATRLSDSATLQSLAYTYDQDSNILTILDNQAGPQTQTFTYDSLNRLTGASATGGTNGLYSETYQYDSATGNLSVKGGLNYSYNNGAHAHAVSSLSNQNTYQYDANGDMSQRVTSGQTFDMAYDAENRMVSVSRSGPAPTVTPTSTSVSTATPTPTASQSMTFTPVADSYVDSSNPTTNYGTSTALRADGSPNVHSYVRFTVSGLNGATITRARLLFYMNSSSGSTLNALAVSDNTWGETTVNYNNAPAMGSTIAVSGALTTGAWATIDVTSYVTGAGTYNFGVTTPGSTALSFAARESGAHAPQLILDLGGVSTATATPTATVSSTNTATPTSTSTRTPTATAGPSATPTNTSTSTSVSTATPTPTASQSMTFTPVADSYVDSSNPTTNYGTSTSLRADGSPNVHSYGRFTVSGLNGATITRARLLFYMNSGSSSTLSALAVTDNTWGETTVNYNNAPAMGSTIATSGVLTTGTWVTLDVTSYVTGAGTYNFGVTTPGSTAVSFAARESGAHAPQLILDLGGVSTATSTPTATVASTNTATPTATATVLPTSTSTRTPTATVGPSATPTNTPTSTSASTATPTPTASQSMTFTPVADSYVDSSNPTTNYGTSTALRADGSPDVHSYVRFTVSGLGGLPITRVRLLFYMNSSSSSTLNALAVIDNTWGETTVNYNNAPAMGSTIAISGTLTTGAWATLDVSSYVTAEGTYNFGVITPGSTALNIAARESGANAPQLIVDLGSLGAVPGGNHAAKATGPEASNLKSARISTWNGTGNVSAAFVMQPARSWLMALEPGSPTASATPSDTPTATDTPTAAKPSKKGSPTGDTPGTDTATATITASPTPSSTSTATTTPIDTATATPVDTATSNDLLPALEAAEANNALLSPAPIFSNGSFIYNGNDERVKSVMTTDQGSTTTYFVGNYYELTGSVVTKYYYAGSQRIAMRVGGTLSFLISDHIGSTSMSTDTNGIVTSEQRYTAWGEVRFSSSDLPTKYSYTGQYSYTTDFGLMFYNARWVDPSLGRFAQADSVLPGAGGSQAFDRYAYVTNNPLRFLDPTGNTGCEGSNWDDGPQCEKTHPGIYSSCSASYGVFNGRGCTQSDFEASNWVQRKHWLHSFAEENQLGKWFDDMRSAIDFMSSDMFFSKKGSITEVMDSGVLQAVNDGWLMYRGGRAVGGGGEGWANFFHEVFAGNARPSDLNKARLSAEQQGVDYAYKLDVVQTAIHNSGTFDRVYFDVFKTSADDYRGLGITTGALDPRKLGMPLSYASHLVYPAALLVYQVYIQAQAYAR